MHPHSDIIDIADLFTSSRGPSREVLMSFRLLNALAIVSVLISEHYTYAADSPAPSANEAPPVTIDEAFLFFPRKFPAGNWNPQGLKFEDVNFQAEDGTKLHGWYCPAEKPRVTILFAHGNAGNVTSRSNWLKILQNRMHASVLVFDYRGYGKSEGMPTVAGILQDARAARSELSRLSGLKESEIMLMGESLGGAVAVQLAAESPPNGLVLQSTFSSLKDAADVLAPKFSWLVPPEKLNSATAINKYTGPLFQSHGTDDRVITFESGQKLFKAANEPKTFFRIERAGHNNWLSEQYLTELERFTADLKALPIQKVE